MAPDSTDSSEKAWRSKFSERTDTSCLLRSFQVSYDFSCTTFTLTLQVMIDREKNREYEHFLWMVLLFRHRFSSCTSWNVGSLSLLIGIYAIRKIIYLNSGERDKDMIDHHSYVHDLSSSEIKSLKKNSGLNGIRTHVWLLRYRCSTLQTELSSQLGAGYVVIS